MSVRPPIVSRTKGYCSTCDRGHGKGARPVTIVKLAPKPLTEAEAQKAANEGMRLLTNIWLGLCLPCAALVAKAIGR